MPGLGIPPFFYLGGISGTDIERGFPMCQESIVFATRSEQSSDSQDAEDLLEVWAEAHGGSLPLAFRHGEAAAYYDLRVTGLDGGRGGRRVRIVAILKRRELPSFGVFTSALADHSSSDPPTLRILRS